MNRREFLQTAAAATGTMELAGDVPAAVEPTYAKLPRWRGFNFIEKCHGPRFRPFREDSFAMIAEWGFDFVRLPLNYRCWSSSDDYRNMKEPVLKEIDDAIEFGKKHKIHVSLNFHRAPGYCVNPPAEPLDLWKDAAALDAFAYQWARFSERYKGIPNSRLSFNLLNEPAKIPEETYVRVSRRLVDSIREHDPNRLIIADGLEWGRVPVHGLVNLRIAQSTRGYDPMPLTHYKANWVQGADKYPTPTWPLIPEKGPRWDKDYLRKLRIEPWKALERKGVGVHVGEWGTHNQTPHAVALAWMRDVMSLWKDAGWGWALWNLTTNFGIIDSGRSDVAYEQFRGKKLDRAMLDVLRADLVN